MTDFAANFAASGLTITGLRSIPWRDGYAGFERTEIFS
jgi:hypothetical protein